ncbi:hypothetical protein BAUCODRAFT_133132 [Baudoinia panamericana UAMH 10762]|uniref:Uncharacterized protein n=1 Tax=Baudoinia panamericana (strain UAMH 10762) TaxID=717646 RepID=M2N371_BAUPA|nr:uncharacterized protein BAUCODRAFT_133132 [Baudoinia panamericana UAMH 10762]EMC93140.1 hypothetical protein BAUCODRAFT_133132 [Baudoinia panamericana UAMH 10762]
MATQAPSKPKITYASIPPPPLPEFYLKELLAGDSNSSTSGHDAALEKDIKQEVVVKAPASTLSDKLPAFPGDGTYETVTMTRRRPSTYQSAAVITIPTTRGAEGRVGVPDVPPLAVYHICRICLRPRSARFHREHPIPINGVPPPPGICRRCRVAPVEEVASLDKVMKVTTQSESNEIKLGIACLMPEEACVSKGVLEERRVRKLVEEISRKQLREESEASDDGKVSEKKESKKESSPQRRKDIVYRHVRAREEGPTLSQPVKERTIIRYVGGGFTGGGESKPNNPEQPTKASDRTDRRSSATVPKPSVETVSKYSGFKLMGEGTIKAAPVSVARVTKAISVMSVSEVEPAKPEHTEADIRKIAREEIKRYRQAERKLEAHSDPYAHGRMVPIQRRIEQRSHTFRAPTGPTGSERRDLDQRSAKAQRAANKLNEHMGELKRKVTEIETQKAKVQVRPEAGVEEGPTRPQPQRVISVKPGWLQQSEDNVMTRQPDSRPNGKPSVGGSDTSGSGWASETPVKPIRSSVRTDKEEARSVRSERRKWDLMTEAERTDQPERRGQPTRVRLREVVEVVDQRRPREDPDICRSTRDWYDVVEIIEEVEVPAKPRTRARERWDHDGQSTEYGGVLVDSVMDKRDKQPEQIRRRQPLEGSYSAAEAKHPATEGTVSVAGGERSAVMSAKRAETDLAKDEASTKAGSTRPSRVEDEELRYRKDEYRSEPKRGPPSLSSQKTQWPRATDTDGRPVRPRASDRRWAAAAAERKEPANQSHDERSEPEPGREDPEAYARSRPGVAGKESRRPASPETEYIETERRVEPLVNDPDQSWRHRHVETEEIYRHGHGPRPVSSDPPPSRREERRYERRHQYAETKQGAGSEHSSRVRFASKVDISPTPPGSEASSTQHRNIGAKPRSKKRLDGTAEEDGESGEALIAEYERRGRARSRSSAPRRDGEREYYYEREEIRPRRRDNECAPSGRSDSGYTPSRSSRPLEEAWSNSPSREWDAPSRMSGSERVDGHGPFHPEMARQESMDVLGGSGFSRAAEDGPFGHAHGLQPAPATDFSGTARW